MSRWAGRITEVHGGMFTAILTPDGHDGPELVADFDMAQCGVSDVSEGDVFTLTPGCLTMEPPKVWTKAEVDAIMRRARERSRRLRCNVMDA